MRMPFKNELLKRLNKKFLDLNRFICLLGTLLIARSGLSTLTVRIDVRLRFSVAIAYSKVLKRTNILELKQSFFNIYSMKFTLLEQ